MSSICYDRAKVLCRRQAALLLTGAATLEILGRGALAVSSGLEPLAPEAITPEVGLALYDDALRGIMPVEGFRSRIVLRDSVVQLARYGVIDVAKLETAAARRPNPGATDTELPPLGHAHNAAPLRPPPAELRMLLHWPSAEPLHLTPENAGFYLNLLWALGLANQMAGNEDSPILGEYFERFASTSGWTLGREPSGSVYFNRFPIVGLSAKQAERVVHIASNTFRPCCDNATFFQDCNHGSALLGLLQLGASQGLSDDELYREALAFNGMWFPAKYIDTALYFRIFHGTSWDEVDPRVALGHRYSAISPWRSTVRAALERIKTLPIPTDQATCSI